ncbi:hypothetical protein FOMPIDRAFT_1056414 [Fomitopsis schrenkii]|uniref:DUF6532 domain-containing protein n=1 Tax=Fomitopsis schrenkii TaxID=2126942 RepID=S8F1Q1_FOMSC|nr:hypothetical protein FOMPIDRAFT_1056414 [Fomitopsis schrenkii]
MQEQSSDNEDESEKSDGDVSPPKRKRIWKGCTTDDENMNREDDDEEEQAERREAGPKTAGKDKTPRSKQMKVPDWIATSVVEYNEHEDHTTVVEDDELDSGGEHRKDSSDEDVQRVVLSKDKGKNKACCKGKSHTRDDNTTSSKGDSCGRAMLRELPNEVCSIVNRAHMFLRLHITVENAWTAEMEYSHERLPEKHTMGKRVIGDVWKLRDKDGNLIKPFDLGFKMLNDKKNVVLHDDLWTAAPQLRNQVKKDAKIVIEDVYVLKNLPAVQRVSAAHFLLKYNQQGAHGIPNFVFGDIQLRWMGDDVDTKVSTVNRKRPFQHPVIYTLITQYWFSEQRDGVTKSSRSKILEMPDNLIAFVCNTIETSLADIATGVHQFTNKVYAPKWVNLMGLLQLMQTQAPTAHSDLKQYLADSITLLYFSANFVQANALLYGVHFASVAPAFDKGPCTLARHWKRPAGRIIPVIAKDGPHASRTAREPSIENTTVESHTTEYLTETYRFYSVRHAVAAQQTSQAVKSSVDDAEDDDEGDFMSWKDIEVTRPSRVQVPRSVSEPAAEADTAMAAETTTHTQGTSRAASPASKTPTSPAASASASAGPSTQI